MAMIKQIPTSELKPGMYVVRLNLNEKSSQEGIVPDISVVETLISQGITHVSIDTEQSINASESNDKPAEETSRLLKQPTTSMEEEFSQAKGKHQEAQGLVQQAMMLAASGKHIDIAELSSMSDFFIGSVYRNQNALACLCRIRDQDAYLMEHSVNVSILMAILGKELQLPEKKLHECVLGALFHDIGKILVPSGILNKPGKLTDDEFNTIKSHPTRGKEILEQHGGISEVALNVVYQHHERMDGRGYPLKLNGSEISLEGCMASTVDVYDAITADRCYHKGMSPSAGLKKLLEWSGDHLNVEMVHHFIKAIGVYPTGSVVELDRGRLGIVLEQNILSPSKPIVRIIYSMNNNCYITPEEIDLSHQSGNISIVRPVSAKQYGIKVEDFVG